MWAVWELLTGTPAATEGPNANCAVPDRRSGSEKSAKGPSDKERVMRVGMYLGADFTNEGCTFSKCIKKKDNNGEVIERICHCRVISFDDNSKKWLLQHVQKPGNPNKPLEKLAHQDDLDVRIKSQERYCEHGKICNAFFKGECKNQNADHFENFCHVCKPDFEVMNPDKSAAKTRQKEREEARKANGDEFTTPFERREDKIPDFRKELPDVPDDFEALQTKVGEKTSTQQQRLHKERTAWVRSQMQQRRKLDWTPGTAAEYLNFAGDLDKVVAETQQRFLKATNFDEGRRVGAGDADKFESISAEQIRKDRAVFETDASPGTDASPRKVMWADIDDDYNS